MERLSLRSRRRALARAAATTLAVAAAIPAGAFADKPAEQRNGPPGPAGNPNHGQAPANQGNGNAYGHAQQQPTPPRRPEGRPVRAHGNPPARPQPAPAPARPARPQRTPQPQSQARAPQSNGNNGAAHQKTTLCHATGSDTNPYVEITISDRAVQAHSRHQDGEDLIPAPAGGCPGSAAATGDVPAAAELAAPVAEAVTAVTEQRAEERAVRGTTQRRGESGVAGVTETSTPRAGADADEPANAVAAAETTEAADDGSLPFTGLELVFVIMVGTALLLAGYALRRSRTTP
jgi:hypothetical protein